MTRLHKLTETAAEAIRSANHHTLDTIGQYAAPDVYRALGELSALAHRLPQLFDQLATNLDHRGRLGGLRLDDTGRRLYPDPTIAVAELTQALRTAAGLAHQLGTTIDHAHNTSAVIADTGPAEDLDDDQEDDRG